MFQKCNCLKRLCKSNQQPNEDKFHKLLAAENEQLTKEQMEERLIKLTENRVLRNKPLNGNHSYYIVDAHPEKITENITPVEPDDSNKTEYKISISEHKAHPENSDNQLPIGVEKMYDLSGKLEKLYIEIEVVKIFIKEQFLIVTSSIKKLAVKKENQESKELLDLIRQQNCVLQKENASKDGIIKILVENQATISSIK